jgi:WD40 repeat protein
MSQVEVANSALSVEKSSDVKSKAEIMANVGENVLADKFQESALVQYSMECNVSSITSSSQHQGALSSLLPIGSRLLSPKANLALYSLDIYSNNQDFPLQWIVGAGKSGIVSIWNCSDKPTENGIDPILTWKAHGGRWISDACFVPRCGGCNYTKSDESSDQRPSILVTAANDGTVCLWDLRSTSSSTGVPKNLATTGKKLHTGGIFSMHVDTKGSNYNDIYICTGSKDKTLAVTPLESISSGALCSPIFVSHHHNSKVGCVQLQGNGSALIGSSSDDGTVAVHDFRVNKVVADIDFAHDKPHSFVWNPRNSVSFITAGHDNVIHGWDLRNLKNPLQSFIGHVPLSTKRCKRIHRPSFFTTNDSINGRQFEYVLSGSENSGCISIFDCNTEGTFTKDAHVSVYSRGNLPMDCGDAGCLAVRGSSVAVAVDGGDVLLLQPKPNKD